MGGAGIGPRGKSRCAVLSSCKQTTSGFDDASHSSRLGSLFRMLLMLKVATLSRPDAGTRPTLDVLRAGEAVVTLTGMGCHDYYLAIAERNRVADFPVHDRAGERRHIRNLAV